ncbi:hypothetical protein ASPFODRAFT_322292 [Aspergillus luchuensis CBS 106.47]|uniref:Uncharacterized protein n=1 Tax=Aspergillus luchuensis (strain CBS 106.47) TaxID=1137211 RepID=A0A1M3T9T2_ASPLC|nr:hypothetical protein ASPFODRAFT_322292 [Aspergillus luchuensis CBS 106.47]
MRRAHPPSAVERRGTRVCRADFRQHQAISTFQRKVEGWPDRDKLATRVRHFRPGYVGPAVHDEMEHYRSQPPELAASLSRIIMFSMLEPLPAMRLTRYTVLYVAAMGDDYRSSPLQTMVALLTICDGTKRARDGVSKCRVDLQFSLQHVPKGILSVHYLLVWLIRLFILNYSGSYSIHDLFRLHQPLYSPPIYKLRCPPYPTLPFIKLPPF